MFTVKINLLYFTIHFFCNLVYVYIYDMLLVGCAIDKRIIKIVQRMVEYFLNGSVVQFLTINLKICAKLN